MDTKFSSSFIPKAPMVGNTMSSMSVSEKKQGFNIFGALAVLIFIVALLSLGGVFAYKKMVENSIIDLEGQLAEAEASLDKAGIEELSNFDKRIKAIKDIINNHVAVSSYLKMLEANTVSNIEFKTLKYTALNSHGPVTISMDGRAGSYAAVALEESVLLQNKDVISAAFDNLALDRESGGVSFIFKGVFRGDLVKFVNSVPNI